MVTEYGYVQYVSVNKRHAKNLAVAPFSMKWGEAKKRFGWRLQRVIVTPVEREQRFTVKARSGI